MNGVDQFIDQSVLGCIRSFVICIFQYVLDTGEGWRGNANKTTRLHSIFTEVETLSDIESPCLWMSF